MTPRSLRLGVFLALSACGSGTTGSAGVDAGAGDSSASGLDAGLDAGAGDDAAISDGGEAGVDAPVEPTIVVTSPLADGGIPTVKATRNANGQAVVALSFATTHFTLAPLGGCGSASQNATDDQCGHVEVFIDGASCDADAGADNDDAFSSPAQAVVGDCPMVDGVHSALLELHHGDRSPILDPSTKTPIGVSLTFTTTGP